MAMLAWLSTGPRDEIHVLDAGKVEPLIPVLPIVDVQQLDLVEVGGPAQGIATLEQLRAADGKQLLGAEPRDVKPGLISVAVTNGQVDVLAREVDMMQRGADPEIDLGVGLGETPQPMHEPLGREVRRRADGEHAAALALQQPLRSSRDAVEGIAHDDEIGASGLGDDQALPLAIEQLQPELGLERLDLMADGALGDAELLGRAREALMARRRLESLERVERRQPARHRLTPRIMRKTTAR